MNYFETKYQLFLSFWDRVFSLKIECVKYNFIVNSWIDIIYSFF
jgi:hypothetical protein